MDNRSEVREFLASRRAKITPAQAGLPSFGGGKRRVPGLRREEVALLAGVSVDYYTQLERGRLHGVSETVLEAIARALQLDEAERTHLIHLGRAANTTSRPRRSSGGQRVRPGVHRVVEAMTDVPAFVRNGRLDVLAINPLGRAIYSPAYASAAADRSRAVNLARFCFLEPAAADLNRDWDDVAAATVAVLRAEAGRDPHDRDLHDLVGELCTISEPFRTRWAAHDVRLHQNGTKLFHHPAVGDLDVTFESMPLPADPGLVLTVYTTEPATTSHDAMTLLASWAATEEATATAEASTATEATSSAAGRASNAGADPAATRTEQP